MVNTSDRQAIEDLVRRSKEGDRDALTDLLAIHEPRLEVCVHLRLGRRLRRFVDLDDVLQEIRLAAFRYIGRFEPRGDGAFLVWLRAIAENIIRNLSRRRWSPPAPSTDPPNGGGGEPSSRDISALRRLQRMERLDQLEKALRQLPPADRNIIILARVYLLPMRVIAERIDCTEAAAGMRLFHAVEKLRKHVKFTFSSWGLPTDAFDRLARMLGTAALPVLPGPPTSP